MATVWPLRIGIPEEMSFEDLVKAVKVAHSSTQAGAVKAINRMQTMRNWIISGIILLNLSRRERSGLNMENTCSKNWKKELRLNTGFYS